MEKLIVIVDDSKDFYCDKTIICRCYDSGLFVLRHMKDYIGELWLDHDLSCDKTGYDLLMILGMENNLPDTIRLISNNPVGSTRMKQALIHDFGYEQTNNYFIKQKREDD